MNVCVCVCNQLIGTTRGSSPAHRTAVVTRVPRAILPHIERHARTEPVATRGRAAGPALHWPQGVRGWLSLAPYVCMSCWRWHHMCVCGAGAGGWTRGQRTETRHNVESASGERTS